MLRMFIVLCTILCTNTKNTKLSESENISAINSNIRKKYFLGEIYGAEQSCSNQTNHINMGDETENTSSNDKKQENNVDNLVTENQSDCLQPKTHTIIINVSDRHNNVIDDKAKEKNKTSKNSKQQGGLNRILSSFKKESSKKSKSKNTEKNVSNDFVDDFSFSEVDNKGCFIGNHVKVSQNKPKTVTRFMSHDLMPRDKHYEAKHNLAIRIEIWSLLSLDKNIKPLQSITVQTKAPEILPTRQLLLEYFESFANALTLIEKQQKDKLLFSVNAVLKETSEAVHLPGFSEVEKEHVLFYEEYTHNTKIIGKGVSIEAPFKINLPLTEDSYQHATDENRNIIQAYVPINIQPNCAFKSGIVTIALSDEDNNSSKSEINIGTNNVFNGPSINKNAASGFAKIQHTAQGVVIGTNNTLGCYYFGPYVKVKDFSSLDYVVILAKSTVGCNVFIGENVVIGENVTIMDGVIIQDSVIIQENVIIGLNSVINRGVYIYKSVIIGNNVKLGNKVVIGENSKIGNGTEINERVFVGENADISDDCKLSAAIRVGTGTVIEQGCILENKI